MDNRTLIRLISEQLDPDELVDVLGYSTDHLCTLLRKDIIEAKHKFIDFFNYREPDDIIADWFEGIDDADSNYE